MGAYNRAISDLTVRQGLLDHGMRSRRPYVGPILTPRHKRARLACTNPHIRCNRQRGSTDFLLTRANSNLVLRTVDVVCSGAAVNAMHSIVLMRSIVLVAEL